MKKYIFGITALLLLCLASLSIAGSAVDQAFNRNIRKGDGKIVINSTDQFLDISKGVVEDQFAVNKFGRALAGIQITSTDIWDRSDAVPTQQIYLAPSDPRIHALVSTSTDDDGDVAGIGAQILRVYGLQSWDTTESCEDVVMDGTTPVNTVSSYVIIHRMKVIASGTSGPNVGVITATAAVDLTIGAEINASEGRTQMAVYGLSSLEVLYLHDWYGSITKASGAPTGIDFSLIINSTPDTGTETAGFLVNNTRGVHSDGSSGDMWSFSPPFEVHGPAIIKVQGLASTADVEGSAGFNGVKEVITTGFTVLTTSKTRALLITSTGLILRTQ